MCKVSMIDVKKRQRYLTSEEYLDLSRATLPPYLSKKLYDEAYNFKALKSILESKVYHLTIEDAMCAFDKVCKYGSISEITYISNYIESFTIPKVRDAAATHTLIKRKLGRVKTKITTKINNNIEDMKAATTDALDNIKDNIATNVGAIQASIHSENTREKCIIESLEKMSNSADIICQCDRVITNDIKLAKRYNVNSLVQRNGINEDALYDTIIEYCKLIDTYNMDLKVKYNVALENIGYSLNKNGIPYHNSVLAETVTDYFLLSKDSLSDKDLADINDVLCRNKFFSDDDISLVSELFAKPWEPITEAEQLKKIYDDSHKSFVKTTIDSFKTGTDKSIEAFKRILNTIFSKIYTKDADQIIGELPNLFIILRVFFLLAVTYINPVIGLVSFITDQVLKLNLERENIKTVIKKYISEIDKTKTAIDKTSDSEEKSRLEKYQKEMEKNLKKLSDYESDLYSDEENDSRTPSAADVKDFDMSDFGLDDDFFNFDEGVILESKELTELFGDLAEWNQSDILYNIKAIISKMSCSDINTLTAISLMDTDILDKSKLKEIYTETVDIESSRSSNTKNYMIIDILRSNIKNIEESKTVSENITDIRNIHESDLVSNTKDSIESAVLARSLMHDIYEMVQAYNTTDVFGVFSEVALTNKLKLAGEKIKKGFVSLSDSEKQLSRKIDMSINTLVKSAERAVTNSNREAIIKGSIIPSASKIIKTAIMSGAAFLINPALAVITLIGTIAVSKKLSHKERQLILDDIEIELKMVDRYVRLAEDKNDMKSLKQLLITQRSLERQKQRIKYNMTVVSREDLPEITKGNDSDSDY